MGLDMYLYKKRYTKNWDHTEPANRWEITIKRGDGEAQVINPTYVIEEAGYWRKANQIHNWFVNNVQDGVDDCGNYYVDREKLEQLLTTVRLVLGRSELDIGIVNNGKTLTAEGWQENKELGEVVVDSSVAQELLPSQSGFFFGGTDYDQWYVRDLQRTEKILVEALAETDECEFEYHSSW